MLFLIYLLFVKHQLFSKNRAENNKVAIRNIRRDLNDQVKKLDLPEDDEKSSLEDVQKMTDSKIEKIVKITENKSKEIMAI